MINLLIPVAAVLSVYAVVLFIISIILRRNDIADLAWGPGIFLAGATGVYFSETEPGLPHYLMLGLVAVWAIRLSTRIYLKNRHKDEDPRYKKWREEWGVWFYPRSFLQVYVLQCFLMAILSMSVLVAALASSSAFTTSLLVGGALVWLLGFLFESVGDFQLDRFLKDPQNKGRLMTEGLWHYTRHPNYFGEVTMWWGLWLMTLSLPLWYVALVSPVAITVLIMYVSGVPMLERMMEKHPDWVEYKRKTNVLVPWWPKA